MAAPSASPQSIVSTDQPLSNPAGGRQAVQRSGAIGDGKPLSPPVRAYFEPRFGRDFSSVRVHDDDRSAKAATARGAQAYAVGEHVVLNGRKADDPSAEGRRVVAHELTHVLQQRGDASAPGHGQTVGLLTTPGPMIQCLDAPPTRFDVSDILTTIWDGKRESALIAEIARLKSEPAADGKPLVGTITEEYANGLDKNDKFNQIALKASLASVVQGQLDGAKYADGEYRLRIRMQKEPMNLSGEADPEPDFARRDKGFVIVRFDKARNAHLELAAVEGDERFSGLEGSLRISKSLMETLQETYNITFVQDATTFRKKNYAGKPWTDQDLILIRDALELIGSTEEGLLSGAKIRRLQGANADNIRGFFNQIGTDRSINFFDDALPFEKGTWVGEDGQEHSYGVYTTLHELGHLLHYSPVGGAANPNTDYLDLFKDAVWAKSGAKRDGSFPPPGIVLPTTYSGTGDKWIDFYAEAYSIYMTNPSFLQTPVHQYLFDFFDARFKK